VSAHDSDAEMCQTWLKSSAFVNAIEELSVSINRHQLRNHIDWRLISEISLPETFQVPSVREFPFSNSTNLHSDDSNRSLAR
jgi:hypothetical protein